jgi:hypothetical protein
MDIRKEKMKEQNGFSAELIVEQRRESDTGSFLPGMSLWQFLACACRCGGLIL